MGTGGKSGGSPPPPIEEQQSGMDSMAPLYMQMMQKQMEAQQGMMQQQMAANAAQNQAPAVPEIYTPPEMDFTEENEKIKNKVRADFGASAAKKKGRESTILTSPLADDEEVTTTRSVLAGG